MVRMMYTKADTSCSTKALSSSHIKLTQKDLAQ